MAFVAGAAEAGAATEATAAVASPGEAAGMQQALAGAQKGPQKPVAIPTSMTGGIIIFVVGYALIYWGWHHMPGQKRYSLWYLLGFGSLFGHGITPGQPVQLGTPSSQPLPPQQPGQPQGNLGTGGTKVATPPAAKVNVGYAPDLPPAQTIKNGSPWWAYPPRGSQIKGAAALSPKKEAWYQASGLPGGVGSTGLAWYNSGAI